MFCVRNTLEIGTATVFVFAFKRKKTQPLLGFLSIIRKEVSLSSRRSCFLPFSSLLLAIEQLRPIPGTITFQETKNLRRLLQKIYLMNWSKEVSLSRSNFLFLSNSDRYSGYIILQFAAKFSRDIMHLSSLAHSSYHFSSHTINRIWDRYF